MRPRIGSLFSGIGGLDLAVEQFFGAETAWHCESDPEPSKVLTARWPGVPNLGDVTKVDWSQVEPVAIMCGGFPCQDLSLAGRRGGMRPGTRSGLWADFKTAIAVLRPKVVVIENVRGLLSGCAESDSDLEPCPGCLGISNIHRPLVRALGRVLGDLAALGFDAEWQAVRASDVGAPHGRFRVFVIAYAQGVGFERGWPTRQRRTRPEDYDGAPVELLGTPTTRDWKDGGEVAAVPVNGLLGRQVWSLLPTPAASNPNDEEDIDGWLARCERVKETAANGNGFGMPLGVAVRLLPTPMANEAEKAAQGPRTSPGQKYLTHIVHEHLLPTPQAHDERGGKTPEQVAVMRARGHGTRVNARLLPTPRASDGEKGGPNQRGSKGDLTVSSAVQSWGAYGSAVRRWETFTRPAPAPTIPDGKNGAQRLSARLPEWMMGYPTGWVTDILGRNPAIKACGNGVVPQQAFHALDLLWPRVLDAQEVAA